MRSILQLPFLHINFQLKLLSFIIINVPVTSKYKTKPVKDALFCSSLSDTRPSVFLHLHPPSTLLNPPENVLSSLHNYLSSAEI